MDQILEEFEYKVQVSWKFAVESVKSECKRLLKQMEEQHQLAMAEMKSQRAEFEAELQAMYKVQFDQDSKVQLNVGGHHFSTSVATLRSKPGTLLDAMFSGRYETKDTDGRVFIDRDGRWFGHVLNYLKNGVVQLKGWSMDTLLHMKREFDFFAIELLEEEEVALVVGGGFDDVGFRCTVQRLDVGSATWNTVASMGTPRRWQSLCSLSNSLYAIGGVCKEDDYLQSVEKYDIELDSWTSVAPLLTARWGHGSCVVGETIYVLGGWSNDTQILASVDKYDVQTDSWSPGKPMPAPRYLAGVCVVADRIYVIGGRRNAEYVGLTTVFVFDCSTEEWSECASLPQARSRFGVSVCNDCVYVFGGETQEGGALASGVKYDPEADSWTELAPMCEGEGISDFGLFQLGGIVYAVGGLTPIADKIATIGRYHPGLNKWEMDLDGIDWAEPYMVTCVAKWGVNIFDRRLKQLRNTATSPGNQLGKKRKA